MPEPVLVVEKSEGIATLTLNRPAARNALSRELRAAIAGAFAELANDAAVRVAILTGAGAAFCAGLDLKELGRGAGPVGAPRGSEPDLLAAMNARAPKRSIARPIASPAIPVTTKYEPVAPATAARGQPNWWQSASSRTPWQ